MFKPLSLITLFVVALMGCTASQRTNPATATYNERTVEPVPDAAGLVQFDCNGKPLLRTTERKWTAVGPSGASSGTDTELRVEGDVPDLTLPDGTKTSGGNSKASAFSKFGIPVGEILCGLAGLAFGVAAAYSLRIGAIRDAIIAGVASLTFFTLCFFPEFALYGIILAAAAATLWMLARRRAHLESESNRATVEALHTVLSRPDQARSAVARASTLPSDLKIFDRITKDDELDRVR